MKWLRIDFVLAMVAVALFSHLLTKFSQTSRSETCAPLAISDEVKKHIDGKINASSEAGRQELADLTAKLAEMGAKVQSFERLKELRLELKEKCTGYTEGVRNKVGAQEEILREFREAELKRLRNEAAAQCANAGSAGGKRREP